MTEASGLASDIIGLATLADSTSKPLYDISSHLRNAGQTIIDLKACVSSLQETLQITLDQAPGSESNKGLELLGQPLRHYQDSVPFEEQNSTGTQPTLDNLETAIRSTKSDLEAQGYRLQQNLQRMTDVSTVRALKSDLHQLQDGIKGLEELKSVVDRTRPGIVVTQNRAHQNSHALFGTDMLQSQFDVHVSDNWAGAGAFMAAGAYSPQTLQGFWKKWPSSGYVAIRQFLVSTSYQASILLL
ncbi:hypothetical protein BDV25DRAFT_135245 [Aspergillus avenaceus]|uniref:Fungal N-terminal domain-containing protein n=1 Tax=Aspergillus avenaceus TaxID=36643 RepID=A0A5N6U9B5_ASPAV|nr:hypothetical protein BDV25DRAFT_135245 [Aspergillus avenaceus]